MDVNRRGFLAGSAVGALAISAVTAAEKQTQSAGAVRINVNTKQKLGLIPADFTGLGYEISSVSIPGLLTAEDRTYVQLVRTLGPSGVIRIGGNTSDYASFARVGQAVSAPKGTIVNASSLRALGTFLQATGWKLIWGLNLGSGDEEGAVVEAQAVADAVGNKLLAFEIGNEPDLFGRGTAHRPRSYGYDDYLKEYQRFKSVIRTKLPNAPFAGPDVAGATDWVTRFATAEGDELRLLTHHYYRECTNPNSTLDKLLHPDPKLAPELERLRAASVASRVPYRICETNSFCGGGKPGVSDTFGAALWVLDFMFTLAYAGCAGVNIETGLNQLGFVSSYSPIVKGQNGASVAQPEYYGMLAFAQAARGQRVAVDCDAAAINVTGYAVLDDRGLYVTIINKDVARNADVHIATTEGRSQARAMRLTAPSLDAQIGIMLGGSPVAVSGEWKPTRLEPVPSRGTHCEIRVPARSAAIVRWEG